MTEENLWVKWFEKDIIPKLKERFPKCQCDEDDTGNNYVCDYHYVERLIKIEIGNHAYVSDSQVEELKKQLKPFVDKDGKVWTEEDLNDLIETLETLKKALERISYY